MPASDVHASVMQQAKLLPACNRGLTVVTNLLLQWCCCNGAVTTLLLQWCNYKGAVTTICYYSYVTMALLQQYCYNPAVTTVLLQHYCNNTIVTTLFLQRCCYNGVVTMALLQQCCYNGAVTMALLLWGHVLKRVGRLCSQLTSISTHRMSCFQCGGSPEFYYTPPRFDSQASQRGRVLPRRRIAEGGNQQTLGAKRLRPLLGIRLGAASFCAQIQ